MNSQTHRVIGLAVAAFVFVASTAQAQGKSHEKDKDKGKDKETQQVVAKVHHNEAHGEVLVRDRNGVIVRDRNGVIVRNGPRPTLDVGGRVPPGLAKKPGGMPPGQYKKRYLAPQGGVVLREVLVNRGYTVVRYADAGPSQYVYYRLRDGSVHRAVITPGTEQLTFTNVPATLLREVLARLY